jgi:hypothetical protein
MQPSEDNNNELRAQIDHLRQLLAQANVQIAQREREVAQLRQELATQSDASSLHHPDDHQWGEGPDPGKEKPPQRSASPSVQQRAQFFKIAYESVLDMDYLNAQGGTFMEHLAAIRPLLKEHMLSLLDKMKSYTIYINYWSRMSRLAGVSRLFFFCLLFNGLNFFIFFRAKKMVCLQRPAMCA